MMIITIEIDAKSSILVTTVSRKVDYLALIIVM